MPQVEGLAQSPMEQYLLLRASANTQCLLRGVCRWEFPPKSSFSSAAKIMPHLDSSLLAFLALAILLDCVTLGGTELLLSYFLGQDCDETGTCSIRFCLEAPCDLAHHFIHSFPLCFDPLCFGCNFVRAGVWRPGGPRNGVCKSMCRRIGGPVLHVWSNDPRSVRCLALYLRGGSARHLRSRRLPRSERKWTVGSNAARAAA